MLIPEITERNKERCEYLLKAFERLGDTTRYVNPTKNIERVSLLHARIINWVYNDDQTIDPNLDSLQAYLDKTIAKIEDENLVWTIRKMLFADTSS